MSPTDRKGPQDVEHAAATDACVLLSGPPERTTAVAYHIHLLSSRCDGEFIVLDCGCAPGLVEARLDEWFATDEAAGDRMATRSTLLLKDVGRLDPALQCKLADALARTNGHSRERPYRIMASTSERLVHRVNEGTFDDALFYRLNVIHVLVPRDGVSLRRKVDTRTFESDQARGRLAAPTYPAGGRFAVPGT